MYISVLTYYLIRFKTFPAYAVFAFFLLPLMSPFVKTLECLGKTYIWNAVVNNQESMEGYLDACDTLCSKTLMRASVCKTDPKDYREYRCSRSNNFHIKYAFIAHGSQKKNNFRFSCAHVCRMCYNHSSRNNHVNNLLLFSLSKCLLHHFIYVCSNRSLAPLLKQNYWSACLHFVNNGNA